MDDHRMAGNEIGSMLHAVETPRMGLLCMHMLLTITCVYEYIGISYCINNCK